MELYKRLAQSSAMMDRLALVGSTKYTAGTSGMLSRSALMSKCRVTPLERNWDTDNSGEMIERHGLS